MKKAIIIGITLVFLVGCASNQSYYDSVNHANETAARIELAKAQAEVERMKVLQSIAQTGDETSRTAAVMALAFGSQQGGGQQSANISNPERAPDAGEQALRWAGVLAPSLTMLYGINRNSAVQMEQIDANKEISINSNDTMLGFGRLAAGKEAPIVGTEGESLLYPRNPADETIVGTEDDVLLFPTN